MGHFGRWAAPWVVLALAAATGFGGCGPKRVKDSPAPAGVPVVRVRVLERQEQVKLYATETPGASQPGSAASRTLTLPKRTEVVVSRTPAGWLVGGEPFGPGEITLRPASVGSLRVHNNNTNVNTAYRGSLRLVPVGDRWIDVVNDVDVESYLKGVVSKEMLRHWDAEAYRAQAIAARTYALYEWRTAGTGRHFDLAADVRSQVYGGIDGESAKSRAAVDDTAGVVLAYGPPGRERIFKTYFSSCCGGITQSASDAFGEAESEPLSERNVGARCNASPRFSWGPVVVGKPELTRRFRLFGARRNRPEKDMAAVDRIDVAAANRHGRPVRFVVTDARGARYSLGGEEIRWAVNTDAPPGNGLNSSFFQPDNTPAAVRFIDGHGWGHGVGLCQWCAQAQAEDGVPHETIALEAFPGSTLQRAY